MIKDSNNIRSGRILTEAYCDSCYVKIFDCIAFDWNIGQKLVYSPLLCEACGRRSNKEAGDNVTKIEELQKQIKRMDDKIIELLKELPNTND